MKKALITGITGQDGSYLAEFLLSKGYEVFGIIRRSSSFNTARIDHLYEGPQNKNKKLYLHYGDLTDTSNIIGLLKKINPVEIYNLAAQSHVAVSFEMPEYTAEVNGMGTLRILEAIRILGMEKTCKFYQASTSELFGNIQEKVQSETTPFYPKSPYASSKLFAYWTTVNYREAYNIYACNGILFNHESPRRGQTFVTRKITRELVKIFFSLEKCLYLGNLNALRDWGHAKDYVKMQWLMLQQKQPEDFVISSGHQISVRDFVTKAAKLLGFSLIWEGSEEKEVGIIKDINKKVECNLKIGDVIVRVDKRYYRPSEVDTLLGNSKKARKKLGWVPKISLDEMIKEMIKFDYKDIQNKLLMEQNKCKIDTDQFDEI